MEKKSSNHIIGLVGREFRTASGVRFTIRDGEFFPHEDSSKQHAVYLASLREDLLVSVPYHGHPVPLITVNGGVFRLSDVYVAKEQRSFKGATSISKALGVKKTKQPMLLTPT